MVRNRTFRARRRDVPYWLLVEDGNAQVKMEIDQQTGPSEALNYSLRLEATQADAENQAGVLNGGYWGMPLKPNTTYKGSFYAKADRKSTRLNSSHRCISYAVFCLKKK